MFEKEKTNFNFSGLEIDITNRLLRKHRQQIDLTFTEFEILYLSANNSGRVFSEEQIYHIVWKESYSGDYNIVTSHILNIREKIEDNHGKPVCIQMVLGVGYRFNQKWSNNINLSDDENRIIFITESCKIPR